MKKMPVLFVGHGSPMNVLDKENPFNQNLSLITQKFAKPKAILMISAHWYSSGLQVSSGEQPEMIYDFYGFPKHSVRCSIRRLVRLSWRNKCGRYCSRKMWS